MFSDPFLQGLSDLPLKRYQFLSPFKQIKAEILLFIQWDEVAWDKKKKKKRWLHTVRTSQKISIVINKE